MTETRWRRIITGDHMREIQSLTSLIGPMDRAGRNPRWIEPRDACSIVHYCDHIETRWRHIRTGSDMQGVRRRGVPHACAGFSAPLLPCRHIARDQREDKEHPLRRGISMKRLPMSARFRRGRLHPLRRGISMKRLPMSARFDVGVCTRFDVGSA